MGQLDLTNNNNLINNSEATAFFKNNVSSIECTNIHDAYTLSLDLLSAYGEFEQREGYRARQVNNLVIELKPIRSKDHALGYLDKRIYCHNADIPNSMQNAIFAWCMTHSDNMDLVALYDERYLVKSTNHEIVDSAYGGYWKYQVPGVIKKLLFNVFSNDATIIMNDQSNVNNSINVELSRGISANFKIQQNEEGTDILNMTVIMSKTDCVNDLPFDLFNFASLHELVRNELSANYPHLLLGTYTHIVNDLYILENDEHKFEINKMTLDEIAVKCKEPEFGHHITYTNFWFYQPERIFKDLKADLFTDKVSGYKQIISFTLVHALIDDIWLDDNETVTNELNIEQIMPVFNKAREKTNEMDVGIPYINERTDVENFEHMYDCLRIAGSSMLINTFITCAMLNSSAENFKYNFEHTLTHASLRYPITKYCAFMSII